MREQLIQEYIFSDILCQKVVEKLPNATFMMELGNGHRII
jgi:translation initiation factor IF-1